MHGKIWKHYYIIFIMNGSLKAKWEWDWDTNARKIEWFNLSSIYLCSFKENIINFMYYFKCSNECESCVLLNSLYFCLSFFVYCFISAPILFHFISRIDISLSDCRAMQSKEKERQIVLRFVLFYVFFFFR